MPIPTDCYEFSKSTFVGPRALRSCDPKDLSVVLADRDHVGMPPSRITQLGLVIGVALLLTGCGPAESGRTGLHVQDGELHAIARTCPRGLPAPFNVTRRDITEISWRVDPAQLFDPTGAPTATRDSVVTPIKPADIRDDIVDITIGEVRDGNLVLGTETIASGDDLTLKVGAARAQNRTYDYFTRSVETPVADVLTLMPGTVLMTARLETPGNQVVPLEDFADAACVD